jgi:hypothetical protein
MAVNKSSDGVSINANVLSITASIVTLILAESSEIILLSVMSLFGSIISLGLNIYLKQKNNEIIYTESIKNLFTSAIFSIFMIYGVAQALKSYSMKEKTDNVSAKAYSIFLLSMSLNIYYAINVFVLAAAIISCFVYIYIIYRIYNKKNLI